MRTPAMHLGFPQRWRAEILPCRPPILPSRHFVYPQAVEEVEKGALETMVFPAPSAPSAQAAEKTLPFLATCALGFRDPAVASGVWACPRPEEICLVAGGYAYMVDTTAPERFTMVEMRPVLEIRVAAMAELLLFIGHRSVLGWGAAGRAWESEKLSDEGITVTGVEDGLLRGMGWEMRTDREYPFAVELASGKRTL